jgi:hypothetical protein
VFCYVPTAEQEVGRKHGACSLCRPLWARQVRVAAALLSAACSGLWRRALWLQATRQPCDCPWRCFPIAAPFLKLLAACMRVNSCCAGGRTSRRVFTSCVAAAQHKDWHLVWSVLPLLAEAGALPAVLGQQLGLRSPPPLSAVLQHLHLVRGWAPAVVAKRCCSYR